MPLVPECGGETRGDVIFNFSTATSSSFPGGSNSQEFRLQGRRPRFHPWVGKIPLEKGMATHFSILAWRIPWTEEPRRLHSMGYKESDMTEQLTLAAPHTFNTTVPTGHV